MDLTADHDLLDSLAGRSAADAFEELGELGDGLPLAEPSEELVEAMVDALGVDDDEPLLLVPPLRGPLTPRRLAIVAALAGCEARHVPVLAAACRCVPEEELNAFGFLTTTGSAAPVIWVNGPAATELGFHGGGSCLGPGNRANATVGRALSLVLRILGGARTGLADMATLGQPAKYTCCFAENEAASPFAPFHVDRGHDAATSTVTVSAISGTVESFDAETGDPDEMLGVIADLLAGSAPIMHMGPTRVGGGQPIVLLTPEWAQRLAQCGFAKVDVQRHLHERAVRREPGGAVVEVADGPDDVLVVVAGGIGIKQAVLPNWNGGARAVTRPLAD